jgi:glutathione synthase/RimK-type ligase-like ATP-grasp enzyme
MGLLIKRVAKKETGTVGVGKYRPMIRSRHPSHNKLRYEIAKLPFRSVIRFGSLTELVDKSSLDGKRIELNSKEAIRNSSSKFRMKQCFTKAKVKTAEWFVYNSKGNGNNFRKQFAGSKDDTDLEGWEDFSEKILEYPIVSKHHFGSRGTGNKLHKSQAELQDWMKDKQLDNYIFEKFVNYNKEYRLHCTKNGCFYACRKMLKTEFKDHPNAWQRHDDNSVWILEENENFDKPSNWDEIIENCVNAVTSCGLDFGACDLRVQNNIDEDGVKRSHCDFIVIEVNSAPSFGDVTLKKYKEELPKLLIEKHNAKS